MLAYIALLAFVAIFDPDLFDVENLRDMLAQNAGLGIVIVGSAFVIIAGHYDLSVGAVAGLSGVLFAKLSLEHSVMIAVLVALLVAIVCGVVNGIVVAVLHVNSFMATFATGLVFAGLALHYQGPRQIVVEEAGFDEIGLGSWGPIPVPVVLTVVAFVIGSVVLHRSPFGQAVYAAGSSREAARLIGLPVTRTLVMTFALSGLTAGCGGLVIASQLGLGSADSGQSLPIEAIAGVVVGGIAVSGGEGRMWQAALGGLILATLNNAFIGLSWSPELQAVAVGLVILLALGANRLSRAAVPQPGSA
ncbi:ABC transporter permease [Nocardioides sp.]|uniref:ABC transporter permease n=1 Tax=Nocardioides sp. TaxID=35761 RepID=UPI003D0E454F